MKSTMVRVSPGRGRRRLLEYEMGSGLRPLYAFWGAGGVAERGVSVY